MWFGTGAPVLVVNKRAHAGGEYGGGGRYGEGGGGGRGDYGGRYGMATDITFRAAASCSTFTLKANS